MLCYPPFATRQSDSTIIAEDPVTSQEGNLLQHVTSQQDSIEERLEMLEQQLARELNTCLLFTPRDVCLHVCLCFVRSGESECGGSRFEHEARRFVSSQEIAEGAASRDECR